MNTILNGLDTMQLAPLQNALDDMTPGMHAAAGYAALQNTHRSMGYVRRHWKDLQTESMRTDTPYEASAGSENGTRFNAWGSFLGASSRAKPQDVIPGCNESMTGLVLGLDYRIGDNLTTGLAGSYTTQSLDQEDGSGSSTIKTFRGYVYGLWDENSEAKGWYIATALGMGAIRFDTDRDLAFLGREAKSDHSAQDYSLLATTGYDMETGNWTIRPSLNLEYIFLHEEGYDESHAGDMNLHIGSHDAHSLQSALGVSIARRCRMKQAVIIPELRLAWTHEFLPEQDDLTSRFLAAGPSFDTPARDIPKDAAVLGLAVKAPLSDMVFAAIDYECTLTEANESTDHRFNAQLRIRF
jgi:outer membrane autotransporter protein